MFRVIDAASINPTFTQFKLTHDYPPLRDRLLQNGFTRDASSYSHKYHRPAHTVN